MFTTIAQFEQAWTPEMELTRKVMQNLTDESLSRKVADGHRTLGRMAWHITTTIPEMMGHMGLKLDLVKVDAPVPSSAEQIEQAYASVAMALLEKIKQDWKDDTLNVKDDLYGEKWERRYTLMALIQHQIHHRGQMTVLMRQTGLKVPAIYGPNKEYWDQYGMKEPEV
jgi:uncharacterized damage-inducible protein DinB